MDPERQVDTVTISWNAIKTTLLRLANDQLTSSPHNYQGRHHGQRSLSFRHIRGIIIAVHRIVGNIDNLLRLISHGTKS
jgi:hypothetical protein